MRKFKAVTFSFDDGITQDQRLLEILNRYGLKATFNINSGKCGTAKSYVMKDVTVAHVKPRLEELTKIYAGHEVAAHTIDHPMLTKIEDDAEVIRQVEEDRLKLSEVMGYEVLGMAYPGGGVNCDARVERLVRERTGVRYARTVGVSHSFEIPGNLYCFQTTASACCNLDETVRLAREFIALETDEPKIFSLYGHGYELDIDGTWDRFEELCSLISGREDIFYGTNREVLLERYWE